MEMEHWGLKLVPIWDADNVIRNLAYFTRIQAIKHHTHTHIHTNTHNICFSRKILIRKTQLQGKGKKHRKLLDVLVHSQMAGMAIAVPG